jgi:hypothetical protein
MPHIDLSNEIEREVAEARIEVKERKTESLVEGHQKAGHNNPRAE